VSVLAGEVTDPSSLVVLKSGWTTLYAIGQITSGVTPPQMLGTFNGNVLDIVGANNRVIACDAAVWDLATHTFVTFSPVTGNSNFSIAYPQQPLFVGDQNGILISIAGRDLAVIQENATGEGVLLFDTSTLPTTLAGE
jgi:hypothetical protein